MKTKILIVLLLFLGSCNFFYRQHTFEKNYVYANKELSTQGILKINLDNTFTYSYVAGLLQQTSEGTYTMKGDSVILNSFEAYKTGFIKHTKPYESDLTEIRMIGKDNEPIALADITLDGKYIAVTNENGVATFNENVTEFTNIDVNYLGEIYSIPFEKKQKSSLILTMSINDITKAFFENAIWIKKGNKLINDNEQVYKLTR
jgi:hypothetical protein